MSRGLDYESRANRFLDAFGAVRDMLGQSVDDIRAEGIGQLMSILHDEARKVVIPSRLASNDDHDDHDEADE